MRSFASTAATLLAGASTVLAAGSAIVINKCPQSTYLWNTPSAGGGFSEIDQVLAPGGTYTQQYQALSNGNGWSLKLAPTDSQSSVMQFEYTIQAGAPTIWFDISAVNGDPFAGKWFISSSDPACQVTQDYYRYSTDNAFGMQAGCNSDTSVTVTLCPDGSSSSGSTDDTANAAAAPASSAPVTSAAPAPVVNAEVQKPKPKPKPVTTSAPAPPQVYTTFVTQVVTVDYTTLVARATDIAAPVKRDPHRHHHAGVQHQHPHA